MAGACMEKNAANKNQVAKMLALPKPRPEPKTTAKKMTKSVLPNSRKWPPNACKRNAKPLSKNHHVKKHALPKQKLVLKKTARRTTKNVLLNSRKWPPNVSKKNAIKNQVAKMPVPPKQ